VVAAPAVAVAATVVGAVVVVAPVVAAVTEAVVVVVAAPAAAAAGVAAATDPRTLSLQTTGCSCSPFCFAGPQKLNLIGPLVAIDARRPDTAEVRG
jgi:hypothetical protein